MTGVAKRMRQAINIHGIAAEAVRRVEGRKV
jgi:hypothetical protein